MHCVNCDYPDTMIVKSIPNAADDMIKRRRECIKCGSRFTTQERIAPSQHKTSKPINYLPK